MYLHNQSGSICWHFCTNNVLSSVTSFLDVFNTIHNVYGAKYLELYYILFHKWVEIYDQLCNQYKGRLPNPTTVLLFILIECTHI